MTADDLTPAERQQAQRDIVRRWQGRRKRAQFAAVRLSTPRIRYDIAGRVIEIEGERVTPRVSRWQEDRPGGR